MIQTNCFAAAAVLRIVLTYISYVRPSVLCIFLLTYYFLMLAVV